MAYVFGLAHTDGSLSATTRNRGRLSFELARQDEELLIQVATVLPCTSTLRQRVRDTNFKKNYESSVLTVFDRSMREQMVAWGLPIGSKSRAVKPPSAAVSEIDYVRGLIDGDGSLGLTELGFPFVSLNTSSDAIAEYYVDFVQRVSGRPRKIATRNKRDDAYNIAVFKEIAQVVASLLYYDGCLALARKKTSARELMAWARPSTMRRAYVARRWNALEDDVVRNASQAEAMRLLGRTKQSVSMRRCRLTGNRMRRDA